MAKLNVTIPVVNVEINGVQYAKVERAAQAGDIVRMIERSTDIDSGAYYAVTEGGEHFRDNDNDLRRLCVHKHEVFAKVEVQVSESQPSEKFRKVDRAVKKGDFVKFTGSLPSYLESDKYYEVIRLDGADDPHVIDEDGDDYDASNRTHEVYESVEAFTYRKVDRDARVGDFVKFNEIYSSYDLTYGEYYKVVEIDYCDDAQIIDDAGDNFDTSGEDFDVYEKVVGGEEQFREVNREAKVGEQIKIVAPTMTGGYYKEDDVLEVASVESDSSGNVRVDFESRKGVFITRREYVVLESTVEDAKYREVSRWAKQGEKIKILAIRYEQSFKVGDILTAKMVDSHDGEVGTAVEASVSGWIKPHEYVVLEPITRRLTVGDYARITQSGGHSYEVGSVVHIVEDDHDGAPYRAKKADGSLGGYISESRVGRATEAEFLAQIKPTRLTVGDYAKVVQHRMHSYEVGSIVKITRDAKDHQPYRAEKADGTVGNWLFESEVEHATEADFLAEIKPDVPTFQVGEKVRLVSGGGAYPLRQFTDGEIYEVTGAKGTLTQIRGIIVGYARPDQLAKLTIEVGSNVKLTIKDDQQPEYGYGSVSNGDIGVVTRLTGNEVKVNFPKQQYWNGLLSELTLVGVQEAVSPEAPTKRFEVGEYARVLVSGKDVAKGSIVEIKRDDRDHNPFAAYAIDGSDWDYFRQDELERDGSEELAKAKETAKWAKIGRKVNEYKVGDIVKFSKYHIAHGLNEFDGIMTEVTDINSSGIPVLAVPSFVSTDYGTNTPIEQVTLITPVESRFDKEAA